MRHYPASNLTPGHPNSLQQVKPKGATDWTSLINDELGYVMDSGTLRIYKFVAASVLAENIPDVVIPDGNATGTGRWEKQAFDGAGGGVSFDDYIEDDTAGGTLYTLRKYEDPFSMVQGTGTGTGTETTPSWEGDVWKDQWLDAIFQDYGTLVKLNSSGNWEPAQANTLVNCSGKLGLYLGPNINTPSGGNDIFVKGTINHGLINTLGGNDGDSVYVSQTVAGDLYCGAAFSQDYERHVGYRLGANSLWFEPTDMTFYLGAGG